MIALDTNVLVRYLLNDDAAQAEAAEALLIQWRAFLRAADGLAGSVWQKTPVLYCCRMGRAERSAAKPIVFA